MIIFFHRIKVRLSWPLPPIGGKYPGVFSVKGAEGITGFCLGRPSWVTALVIGLVTDFPLAFVS